MKKQMKIESLQEFILLSQPLFSPAAGYLLYRQTRIDMEKNCYPSRIMAWDRRHERPFPLTAEDVGSIMAFLDETQVVFSAARKTVNREGGEDGQTEKNTKKRDGNPSRPDCSLYKISLLGGEAEHWLTLPYELAALHVLNENELLLQVNESAQTVVKEKLREGTNETEHADGETDHANVTDSADDEADSADDEADSADDEADYAVLEELPFWRNGEGYSSGKRTRIYRYFIDTAEAICLSEPHKNAELLALSEDKERVLLLEQNAAPRLDLMNRLFVLQLQTSERTEIKLERPMLFKEAAFAGEAVIFAATDMKKYGLNEDSSFYLWQNNAPIQCLKADANVGNSLNSDAVKAGGSAFLGVSASVSGREEAGVYYIGSEGESSHLNFLSVSGLCTRISHEEGAVMSLAVSAGQVAYVALRANRLAEVFLLSEADEAGKRSERQITEASDCLDAYELSQAERFAFRVGEDELIGFVMKPLFYEAGKSYPGILTIHGGPRTIFSSVFHHEMQVLAAQGYFVFYTNPRGSDGRGDDWADIRGRYGEVDYQQLMAFTDVVLERYPDMDGRRLAVMGGSYGGFMSNWIIGHTGRFRAACTQRSISNWFSMYGISDIGYYFTEDQTASDPWQSPEKLWSQSPLKYAEAVQTPTLIIHSDEDYRCPLSEGLQLFTALKLRDLPCRMVIFKGENHELSRSGRPRHRRRRLQEIIRWFRLYLS